MLRTTLPHTTRRFVPRLLGCFLAAAIAATTCYAQEKAVSNQSSEQMQRDLLSNRELLASFGRVAQKIQADVKLPEPRLQSRLLPLLPKNTLFFAAIPNYGSAAERSLEIFRQDLKDDAALKDWWSKGDLSTNGPKIEEAIEKFYLLHQFLGDEIVLSGSLEGNEPKLLLLAETRKPGLDKFLGQLIEKYGGARAGVRLVDPQELAATRQKEGRSDLLVVVRPDVVFVSEDVALLRSFNASLNRGAKEFLATPFGTRVATEYRGGLTILGAANIEAALGLIPPAAKEDPSLQQSGFAEAKYFVWDHKRIDGKDISQSELSFAGPRHGIASWLAKPGPMATLDFVSPEAFLALALRLKNPALIFDDIQKIAKPDPGSPFAMLPQAEQALGISVRDDVLNSLSGDLAIEVDDISDKHASWRATLGLKDLPRLQKALSTLLVATQMKADETVDGGISYSQVRIPSSSAPSELHYAFVDNFLVIGSSHDSVVQGAKLHRAGGSVAKSDKFLSVTPAGHTAEASAVWYQNPSAIASLQLRKLAPELAQSVASGLASAPPSVAYLYGEESSIKSASNNNMLDVGGVLVVAAVAIPNLIKSKAAADQAAAVGSLRTIVTAQIAYSSSYPKLGFAQNLATLGPDPKGNHSESAAHADLVDLSLAGPHCMGDIPCVKSGYRFQLTAACKGGYCGGFVTFATPVNPSAGSRSFCATEDGVIRFQLTAPARFTTAECKKWVPLQ